MNEDSSTTNSRPDLRVFLLGPFRLEIAGRELPLARWKSKKALAVFKYLVSRRGAQVSLDELEELFWSEADNPRHNLHAAVYLLRRMLEPGRNRYQESRYIQGSNGLYTFPKEPDCWVDAEEFSALCRKGSRHLSAAPDRARHCLEQAIALYRGDFLPEEVYEDWTMALREGYREMYFEAAVNLAQLYLARKETAVEAARLCRKTLLLDPFREELYQVLIKALIQTGQYAAAEYEYRQCAKMLKNEFGLEPSPQIRALLEALESHRQSAADLEPAAEPVADGPFVCDPYTFRSIFSLETRRQRRSKETLALVVVDLGDGAGKGTEGETLLSALTVLLRRGDVICRWDARRTLIQLPHTDRRAGAVVERRLVNSLKERLGRQPAVTISYLEPTDQERSLGGVVPEPV